MDQFYRPGSAGYHLHPRGSGSQRVCHPCAQWGSDDRELFDFIITCGATHLAEGPGTRDQDIHEPPRTLPPVRAGRDIGDPD